MSKPLKSHMQISKMFSTPAVLGAIIKEQQNKSLTTGELGKTLHITEVKNIRPGDCQLVFDLTQDAFY